LLIIKFTHNFWLLAANGPRVCEGAGKKAISFNFAPTLAKPFFYLLIYIFYANKKWFLRWRKYRSSVLHLTRSFANTMLADVFFLLRFG